MKKHFKKYDIYYKWAIIIILAILTITFLYLGYQNKQKTKYSPEEVNNLLKLRGDIFSKMIQIELEENTCNDNSIVELTKEQMETYDFDSKLYLNVSYELKCKDGKQKILINIVGNGPYKGYEIKNYEAQ